MKNKKILGLDLGTNSIGWALVDENQASLSNSKIIKLGVRVNPLSVDEKTNFEKGKPLSTNADRTLKRGARRNLQRFKLRRKELIEILVKNNIINQNTILTEVGKNTTHLTLSLRAKAATEKVELEDLAKIFLAINKKRGYKSSRKSVNEDEGVAVDGMSIAKELYDRNITPGEYVLELLISEKKYTPDFYRSDLQAEFDKVWSFQKQFYPKLLTEKLYNNLQGKNKGATWKICEEPFGIKGVNIGGKTAADKKVLKYQARVDGLSKELDLETLAVVFQEINNNLNNSSGYLGAISDRSKELYFDNLTVGQYLYNQVVDNFHTSLKNQVFYRQDYLDEFEKIWETQAKFHKELTPSLKKEIRDVIIFFQRKLKSQKGLLSFCPFESREQKYFDKVSNKEKTRVIGQKVIPKSSPLFQEFKIWQNLNNLVFTKKQSTSENEKIEIAEIDKELRVKLFNELNLRGDLKPNDILKLLKDEFKIGKISEWECNFEKIEGNKTNKSFYNVYQAIAEQEGYGFDWKKKTASEIKEELKAIFPQIGINNSILDFNADLAGELLAEQDSYLMWHLLYASEDDQKISKDDKLIYGNNDVAIKKILHQKYGFKPEYGALLANIRFEKDYGNLSARAIRKIMPFLYDGNNYAQACALAGYNHSNSLTQEELKNRVLKSKLEILKKNSLRNPVVEKILNQMVNVVNQVSDEYGKPDEIRIELARELKQSAKQREVTTKTINSNTRANDDIRKIIKKDFGFTPTKNDVIRYKLYQELKNNGYNTLFTNKYIEYKDIYSKNIDIEHIIPKAVLFDDSFSNKTLAYRKVNLKKGARTAIDFIEQDYKNDLESYKDRVEDLFNSGAISKGKYKKLLTPITQLDDGFIARDLNNTQYIAKKAKEMLFEVFPTVISTSGKITSKLREDWGLINIMKELSLPKYRALGLTEIQTRKDSKEVEIIKDWTKRNDHRHHAMDALAIAFTSHNHIQYINHLNARKDEKNDLHKNIKNIESKIKGKVDGKVKFIAPMPNFRQEAKKHIESILISFKTKNKVVTKNVNKTKIKGKDNYHKVIQLTPRGQLHKETVYGKAKQLRDKPVKLTKKFKIEDVSLIVDKEIRAVIANYLKEFNNNPMLAFDTKTLKKKPLVYKGTSLTEVICFEEIYTIRKEINSDNFKDLKSIDKIIDEKIKRVLIARLKEYNNAKEAFSDLDKKPIWLNEEKGIAVKRATIKGVSSVEALHSKKDHLGNDILDENGNKQPVDFVSTGNNHHVAIYKDQKGKLQEKVVSFYEAVARVNLKLPVVNKAYNSELGWEFQFTMKQNELFIFPTEEFNPTEIDLLDEANAHLISPHLFRVQKIGSKDYTFRHHLETTVTNNLEFTYKRKQNTGSLNGIIKVRTNHVGKIVQVGEYD